MAWKKAYDIYRVKQNESKKKNKYLNLERELKENYGIWKWK